jgi:hypothetical protein
LAQRDTRVLVIHRDTLEATARAARLRDLGFDATPYLSIGDKGFRGIRQDPPHAILIDLTRMPSYGRAVGVLLRERKSLGTIPLVFVEGDPEKTAKVRAVLPEAIYTTWAMAPSAIGRAIRNAPPRAIPPRNPVTPLLTKLGIRTESRVAMLHPPEGFELPGVIPLKRADDADVVMLFFRNSAALGSELPDVTRLMRKGRRVWVLWPKKASGVSGDLSMVRIREMARDVRLVDYKVCSVDETWSAMALGPRAKLELRH